ncbi:hypothetical protein QBC35DRAFT_279631 [Podospora australis]|uniref:SPRY domain-containing protein n=1 Tax=Podospora australis TaxID=1536484 RepID=A0AAN6X5P7_9PEZI|nr:hypothetical protein QBC35DRAFT_279631 [Podospora australis]
MCFGSKKKNLYDDVDEPPRPAPGHAPQQPVYAPAPDPKAPSSASHQHQDQPQQQYNPSPASPQHQTPSYQQQLQAQAVTMPAELPNTAPTSSGPVELSGANDYAPPPGPPPSHSHGGGGGDYAPPPGPPPSHARPGGGGDYAPPPGPPPSHDFAPPPGPPPSHGQDLSYIAPPPGPPPSSSNATEKPKHEWESLVPDTSLFPPPPSFFTGFDRSPATNATEQEAEAGETYCAQHPLTAPIHLDPGALEALRNHNPRLMEPAGFRGTLKFKQPGIWEGKTVKEAMDTCIIGYPPLYPVTSSSPLMSPTGLTTIYYEVLILSAHNPREICLSLGYTALPYPSFRQPGWHRGSLAVHGDDGHKFINDRWGGRDFTAPFQVGERYGIGMTFRASPPGSGRIETEVFFTRNGHEAGRWNLHEESDAEQDLPVTGLEGYHDLSCAVGTYGGVGFEIIFDPAKWTYTPREGAGAGSVLPPKY